MACVVTPASGAVRGLARTLAAELEVKCVDDIRSMHEGVALVVDTDRSWLQRLKTPRLGPVYVDFSASDMLHRRRSGHNEPLGRAIGVKPQNMPRVFDATAGLGRDAFVLADLGCSVTLSEVSGPLCFLLRQAIDLARLSSNPKVCNAAQRMEVVQGDSCEQVLDNVDVIYIDPMFPERTKTAAVKKDLATIQALHDRNDDLRGEDSLLAWAMGQDVDRIVVKRPAKSAPMTSAKPSHSILGKTIRFDVFVKST